MHIRQVTITDATRLAEYYVTNAAHFCAWEPVRATDYYTQAAIQTRLTEYEAQRESASAAHFISLHHGQVIAHCSLSNIVYGPFRAAYLGYGVDQHFEGRGVMSALCRAVLQYAFAELQLNRVMANYMPANQRSAKLLEKLGFSQEGLARRYLQINGRWEDHVLTALLNPANH